MKGEDHTVVEGQRAAGSKDPAWQGWAQEADA